jgi:hypothetical protein
MTQDLANQCRIMQSHISESTDPDSPSDAPVKHRSSPFSQECSSAFRNTIQMYEEVWGSCSEVHTPIMFSDPLNDHSLDEWSFEEVVMYGSDSDVETISLQASSIQEIHTSDVEVVCM